MTRALVLAVAGGRVCRRRDRRARRRGRARGAARAPGTCPRCPPRWRAWAGAWGCRPPPRDLARRLDAAGAPATVSRGRGDGAQVRRGGRGLRGRAAGRRGAPRPPRAGGDPHRAGGRVRGAGRLAGAQRAAPARCDGRRAARGARPPARRRQRRAAGAARAGRGGAPARRSAGRGAARRRDARDARRPARAGARAAGAPLPAGGRRRRWSPPSPAPSATARRWPRRCAPWPPTRAPSAPSACASARRAQRPRSSSWSRCCSCPRSCCSWARACRPPCCPTDAGADETGLYHRRHDDGGTDVPRAGRDSGRERVLETAYRALQPARHEGGRRRPDHRRVGRGEDDALSQLRVEGRPDPGLPRAPRGALDARAGCSETVESRAATPAQRLLAIFDVFGEWFARDDFEGCSFINVMLELDDPGSPVRQDERAPAARDPRLHRRPRASRPASTSVDGFARQWHILMKGCIVAAAEGDREAGARARELGVLLLAHHGITA